MAAGWFVEKSLINGVTTEEQSFQDFTALSPSFGVIAAKLAGEYRFSG
ncbi:MAG: hypothetical protein WKF74_15780 [Pyrinomonadaceae bacterium]